jgi:phenylpyruvate tautomerase PptA (4-oxalocrotonate tautomerase family)
MPCLQLDVTRAFTASDKQRLAAALSETYARMMSVDIRRISVAIRDPRARRRRRVAHP